MAHRLPIGLDIGTTAVRLMQLAGSGRRLRVLDAAKAAIPPYAEREAGPRREAVVECVRALLKDRHFRGHDVVLALDPAQVAIRSIRLPPTPEEELPTAVKWEVQNKFPFDMATAVVQYLPAGHVRQGDRTLQEVLVLAVPRQDVEARVHMAAEAGLHVVSVDASPCALWRTFERYRRREEDRDVVTAIVDLGARTQVVLARGRDIVFVKTIPIGGTLLNRAVAERLELAATEAQALRRRLAKRLDRDDPQEPVRRAVADAVRPHLEDLAAEIGLCLRYHSVSFGGPLPGEIIFSGGEAHDPTVPQTLAARLDVQPTVAEPLAGIEVGRVGPGVDRRGATSEWTVALGLSLKGLSLAEPLQACA